MCQKIDSNGTQWLLRKRRDYIYDTSSERVKKVKSSWQGVLEMSIEY